MSDTLIKAEHNAPEIITAGAKRCTHCHHMHNRTEFHRDNTARDGLHSSCKWCKNSQARSRRIQSAGSPPPKLREASSTLQSIPQALETQPPPMPRNSKICTSCGRMFVTTVSMSQYQTCENCRRQSAIANKKPLRYPTAIATPISAATEDKKIALNFATRELIGRHKMEFHDIYVLVLEDILQTRIKMAKRR